MRKRDSLDVILEKHRREQEEKFQQFAKNVEKEMAYDDGELVAIKLSYHLSSFKSALKISNYSTILFLIAVSGGIIAYTGLEYFTNYIVWIGFIIGIVLSTFFFHQFIFFQVCRWKMPTVDDYILAEKAYQAPDQSGSDYTFSIEYKKTGNKDLDEYIELYVHARDLMPGILQYDFFEIQGILAFFGCLIGSLVFIVLILEWIS